MWRILLLLFTMIMLAAGGDWLTKHWAAVVLADQPAIRLVGEYLQLRLGFNTGVAFSLFAGAGLFVPVQSLQNAALGNVAT